MWITVQKARRIYQAAYTRLEGYLNIMIIILEFVSYTSVQKARIKNHRSWQQFEIVFIHSLIVSLDGVGILQPQEHSKH